MGERFDVVPFGDRWEEPHAEFARRNYPGKTRRADPAYLRWKFRGPSTGDVPGLMLATQGRAVIGQIGLLPGILDLRGVVQPTQWVCEMMVEPEQRRTGVTRALFDEAWGRGLVSLGSDPSAVAHKAVEALGMGFVESSWVMILPLKLGPVVAKRYPQAARAERLLSLASSPAVHVRNRRLAASARNPSAKVCRWKDVVQLVADYEATIPMPHAVHDEEFLAWRCGGADPWKRELEAVRTADDGFAIFERDSKRLTVHEWHANGDADALALFGRIHYLAGSYGVDFIQTYAAVPAERATLEGFGFAARRTRTEACANPSDALTGPGGGFAFMGYDNDYFL